MKTNPWFRLYHEFATDPKVQMLNEADQRRYLMVLCLRCRNGDVTLHDDEVAFQLRISCEEWSATKARLIERGLICDGNKPVAWEKRQYASDRSNDRVSRHRAKKKLEAQRACNVTVAAPESDADTEAEEQSVSHTPEPARANGQTDDPNFEKCKLAFNGSTSRLIDELKNSEGPYGTKARAAEWLADTLDDFGAAAILDAFKFLERCRDQGQAIRDPKAFLTKNAQRHVENRAAKKAAEADKAKRIPKGFNRMTGEIVYA